MIVGTFFDGDDDAEIAWKQHDVYGEALGAIIQVGNRLTLFAKSLLDDKAHASWGTIETCDHRTLQGAHDILAAAWRFQNDFRQSDLPLERRPEPLVPHTPGTFGFGGCAVKSRNGYSSRHLSEMFS